MTQGELEEIPLPFEQQMSSLEMRIMTDIVRAIKANGFATSTADSHMQRLIQLGISETNIKGYIKEALKATEDEFERVFSDEVYAYYYGYERAYRLSGMEQIPFKENIALQELLSAVKAQTRDSFQNMTNSTGFAIRNLATGKLYYSPLMDFYQDTLDSAVMDIVSGTSGYDKALSRAINTMTNSGLRWIDYDSGYHSRVNVAARNAVMTGFRQVQGKINEQVAKDLNTDSYEVTCHMGARASHQVWQGRVYTMRELISACGLGTVTGLHGANCYHDYNAFIPEISARTYTDEQLEEMMTKENTPKRFNGKDYTTYDALQEQRKQERVMRKTRQDIKLLQEGDASREAITIKQARYQGEMYRYKVFSEKMGLPEQRSRVYHDGLGKMGKVGNKVINNVDKSIETAIIKEKKLYRKKASELIEPMQKKQLQKIVKGFKRNGGVIQMSDATVAYLKMKRAEAITLNHNTILLSTKPGRAAVFEELIHATQWRQGKNDGTIKRRLECEIEAQKKLLRYQKVYKLTMPEVRQTEKALIEYKKELNNLLRGGE